MPATRKQTKLLHRVRAATALVCAYALALTTILSAWTANAGSVTPGSDFSVICGEHNAGSGHSPAGGDDSHQRLCAMLCSLQAGSADATAAPAGIALPRRMPQVAGRAAPIDHLDLRTLFLKDHQVRGPPLPAAA